MWVVLGILINYLLLWTGLGYDDSLTEVVIVSKKLPVFSRPLSLLLLLEFAVLMYFIIKVLRCTIVAKLVPEILSLTMTWFSSDFKNVNNRPQKHLRWMSQFIADSFNLGILTILSTLILCSTGFFYIMSVVLFQQLHCNASRAPVHHMIIVVVVVFGMYSICWLANSCNWC